MYNGGVVSYLLLGAFVVLFSTAVSQKNTAPAKNANSAAKPAANPSVSKKADPIEQRDATTPMRQLPSRQQAPTAAPAPVAPAAAVAPKATNQMARPPVVPKATNQMARPPVVPKATNQMARRPMAPRTPPRKPAKYIPRDPIVHARPITPEPKQVRSEPVVHARPTTPEPKEVDAEGTTSGYYYDYYNNYNSQYDGRNGSGINQGASPKESACPVFRETIMEHHVILRRNGCEIVLSQDDAIRWFGRPTGPLVYSRKYI
ncbi:uncharacterized protein LOC128191457 isoform X1 [Crassostrea angulata]|uniref:uncharacterized protein LOC128191457 isoform X1 n=1 Tax=Magallana angulata TaxID=2784310 RepID=UPI0022B199B7|nr:uncharacterized protein LOC128191457 isoform X1 [Crassostrea angulata]